MDFNVVLGEYSVVYSQNASANFEPCYRVRVMYSERSIADKPANANGVEKTNLWRVGDLK